MFQTQTVKCKNGEFNCSMLCCNSLNAIRHMLNIIYVTLTESLNTFSCCTRCTLFTVYWHRVQTRNSMILVFGAVCVTVYCVTVIVFCHSLSLHILLMWLDTHSFKSLPSLSKMIKIIPSRFSFLFVFRWLIWVCFMIWTHKTDFNELHSNRIEYEIPHDIWKCTKIFENNQMQGEMNEDSIEQRVQKFGMKFRGIDWNFGFQIYGKGVWKISNLWNMYVEFVNGICGTL